MEATSRLEYIATNLSISKTGKQGLNEWNVRFIHPLQVTHAEKYEGSQVTSSD